MELQFNRMPCNCLRQLRWEVQNGEQTQEVKLTDDMPDIGKVLACWGQVLLRGKEWRSGGMQVSGGVMAWVLYAPEDGTEPRSVETWLPFQMKWDLPESQRDGTIIVRPLLRGVDARSTSARKMMVRGSVCLAVEALEPGQVDIWSPESPPEDIHLLRSTYPVTIPREAGEKIFEIDDDVNLPSSAPEIKKILRYTLQPELIDQKVMAGKVVFRGTAILRLLYLAGDGLIKSWDFEIPFSQFSDLDQDYDLDATACVVPAVTGLELETQEDGSLHVKAGMVGQYLIYDRIMLELVEDAYSPQRELSVSTEELELPVLLERRRENIHAQQSMEPEGNQVVDCCFFPEHPNSRRSGDAVEMEIPGSFQLLSYDPQGNLHSANCRWEGNFSMKAGEDCRLSATAASNGLPQAVMAGDRVDLNGDLALDIQAVAARGMTMVTGIRMGEKKEPDPNRPSLVLRSLGQDRLWDLAKRCGSTVEAIHKANGLNDEPERDRILLIPVS